LCTLYAIHNKVIGSLSHGLKATGWYNGAGLPSEQISMDNSNQVQSASDLEAQREKTWVAMTSVVAAVFLTVVKLIVGVITGSLGILSEAAHSALDLVAALVTYFAVRLSGKPADDEHTYGHGKIENLSALFETLLLLVTCVWIIYEALQRLFVKSVEIETSPWAFIIMAGSIVIDLSRSRALMRVAKKYDSQALEADALHFSTDVWSSSVVIVGLIFVWLAERTGVAWLVNADAIAALGVAGIVIYVSIELGMRTIRDLLDAVPSETRKAIRQAVMVPGVLAVPQVRVRKAGPDAFADVTLEVRHDTSLERAHQIADQVEFAVQEILPGADVVVHVEPQGNHVQGVPDIVRRTAAQHNLSIHSVRLFDLGESQRLEMHVEVSDSLSVEEAHSLVTGLEDALKLKLPGVDQVLTHIEPASSTLEGRRAAAADKKRVLEALDEIAQHVQVPCGFHDIEVRRVGSELFVAMHCHMEGETGLAQAHDLTQDVENALRSKLPELARVLIHIEPEEQSFEEK
jgi:cation diffusion facilitator family transporter